MDSTVAIRRSGYERTQLVFLLVRKERVLLEPAVLTVFDVLKLLGVNMYIVQFEAQLCKLAPVLLCAFGVVAAGTGIGLLAFNAAETYTHPLAVRNQVARFGSRDA